MPRTQDILNKCQPLSFLLLFNRVSGSELAFKYKSIFNEKIYESLQLFKKLTIERSGDVDSLLLRKTDLGLFNQERGVFYRRKLFSVITAGP